MRRGAGICVSIVNCEGKLPGYCNEKYKYGFMQVVATGKKNKFIFIYFIIKININVLITVFIVWLMRRAI